MNCANLSHVTEMRMAMLFVGAARKRDQREGNGESEPVADTHVAPQVPPVRLGTRISGLVGVSVPLLITTSAYHSAPNPALNAPSSSLLYNHPATKKPEGATMSNLENALRELREKRGLDRSGIGFRRSSTAILGNVGTGFANGRQVY